MLTACVQSYVSRTLNVRRAYDEIQRHRAAGVPRNGDGAVATGVGQLGWFLSFLEYERLGWSDSCGRHRRRQQAESSMNAFYRSMLL